MNVMSRTEFSCYILSRSGTEEEFDDYAQLCTDLDGKLAHYEKLAQKEVDEKQRVKLEKSTRGAEKKSKAFKVPRKINPGADEIDDCLKEFCEGKQISTTMCANETFVRDLTFNCDKKKCNGNSTTASVLCQIFILAITFANYICSEEGVCAT